MQVLRTKRRVKITKIVGAVPFLALFLYGTLYRSSLLTTLNKVKSDFKDPDPICYTIAETGKRVCRPNCSHLKGYFSLPGMTSCRLRLTCKDSVEKLEKISTHGAVKIVHKAKWENYTVALNSMSPSQLLKSFTINIKTLEGLNPSRYVTQLIGVCNNTFISEFHNYGSSENYHKIEKKLSAEYRSPKQKLSLCINYVKVIHFLHHSPLGTLMMCDSNSVHKTLMQFLLTDDLRIVLNDVDCVPKVDPDKGVVCNDKRHIEGTLLAPEQLWPHKIKKFNVSMMPPYNEKVDIWRIPEVCGYFLHGDAKYLMYFLSDIHQQCKNKDPSKRPETEKILQRYYQAQTIFNL